MLAMRVWVLPSIFLGLFGFAVGAFAAAPLPLFLAPAPSTLHRRGLPEDLPGRRRVAINPAALGLQPNDELLIEAPSGRQYTVVIERRVAHGSNGLTLVGRIRGSDNVYRAVLTHGHGVLFGHVLTPDGTFQVTLEHGEQFILDPDEAGLSLVPVSPDDAIFPDEFAQPEDAASSGSQGVLVDATASAFEPTAAQLQEPFVAIDLLVLYAPSLVERFGSTMAAQVRIQNLVDIANQAYLDSDIYIELQVVLMLEIASLTSGEIVDETESTALLSGMRKDSFIATTRDLYGADLVSLILPYNRQVDPSVCGRAYFSSYLSLAKEGRDLDGSRYYCNDWTLVHELGHNLGSNHDRANASGSAAYSYSYGYGIDGLFGTVMSYISPAIGRFSNPRQTCPGGGLCGIPIGLVGEADNVTSINNEREWAASLRVPEPSRMLLNAAALLVLMGLAARSRRLK